MAKVIGGPGSAGFLALCCAIGLAMACIGPRSRRAARVWVALVCTTYVMAALPLVSDAVANRLPPYAPVWKANGQWGEDILVVLSGDNPGGRAREARQLLNSMTPRCVLVSGSPWFVRMIVAAGVARERLTVDNTTSTTREQIAKLATWTEQCGAQRVVLIASAMSMPRVAGLVRTAGVPVVLAPSPLDAAPASSGIRLAVPSLAALRVTRVAFYEHAALAYYRHHQWIH